METLYSVGPLKEGNGLNITVWSYCEQLNFSVICCPGRVKEPHRITRAIAQELKQLKDVTGED